MRLAWDHAEEPDVTHGLVTVVESRVKECDEIFGKKENERDWRPSKEARRAVAQELFTRVSVDKAGAFIFGQEQLLDQEDLPWLLDEYERSPDSGTAPIVAKLISSLAWQQIGTSTVDRAIGMAQSHAILGEAMADMIQPVQIDSPKAEAMREHYRLSHSPRPNRAVVVVDRATRVSELLEKCESKDIGWWWDLTQALSIDDAGVHFKASSFDGRILAFRGWSEASAETQARFVGVARRYVLEGDPANDAWFGTGEYRYSALAGYRALELLREQDTAWFRAIDPAVWRKWIPIVVSYPSGPTKEIIQAAYLKCPEDVLERVLERVEAQSHGDRVDANKVLDGCWCSRIADTFLAKAEGTTSQSTTRALVQQGAEHKEEHFVHLGERIAKADGMDSSHRVAILNILIRYSLNLAWTTVWQVMQQDRPIAREAWLSVVDQMHRDVDPMLRLLTPDQEADLYIWLVHEFPEENRGRGDGWFAHRMSHAELLSEFRGAVLRHLRGRGEQTCLPAVDRIIAAFPDRPFIKLEKVLTRRAVAQGTWRCLSPHDFATLMSDAEKRVVDSGDQLLCVVLESLQRYQETLHDELSGVRDLWDKRDDSWRPIDEPDLSDRIARHLRIDLQNRGLAVNREVKIRRGRPGVEGQQTDIYVDAVAPTDNVGTCSRISLIIEVKGCWNDEVHAAMQSQLVDRYLHENSCGHGLYLVGWFLDDAWDAADGRRGKARRHFTGSIESACKDFAQQATTLTRDGKTLSSFVLDARLRRI